MAVAGEENDQIEGTKETDEGFVWDADSNLFYHACTGFYHDPIAGWYYSSRDGLYYAFQDGNYVPLEPKTDEECESNPSQGNECSEETSPRDENESESYSRPSEWLDEILINQYLSGYPKPPETNSDDQSTDKQTDVVLSSEEESWLAQYGQVERSSNTGNDVNVTPVDIWDWELVKEGQNGKIAKLTGRLVGKSSKLHPSLSSSRAFIKTAAIRQTNLDLVRVSSGKVYRLRTPSKKYWETLLVYDSSNPTKDWGFPPVSPQSEFEFENIVKSKDGTESKLVQSGNLEEKQVYRDRAAERRRLHGVNNIAPCQKGINNNNDEMDIHLDATSAQEEAKELSFGTGSYARKIMQNMGWKDGEALGSSRKGIKEPLQALGNKGQAGLGWKNHNFTLL